MMCKTDGCSKLGGPTSGLCRQCYNREYRRKRFTTGRVGRWQGSPTPEDIAKAKQMRVGFKSWNAIGEATGWTPKTIKKAVERDGAS